MKDYIITISRSFGSGGKQIGMMLSEELGIPYYDNELLRMASDESGISENILAQSDERINNRFLGLLSKSDYEMSNPSHGAKYTSEDSIFNYQAYIIRELAEQGSCIFIGRAADYVLREKKNILRIDIESPFDSCVSRIMEMYALSEQEAIQKVIQTNNDRNEYYRYHTGEDRGNPLNYDLTINTKNLDNSECVQLIAQMCEIKFGD